MIAWASPSAYGTLHPAVSATSYAAYSDRLGASASYFKDLVTALTPGQAQDPAHHGWPYGGSWWQGSSGSSALHWDALEGGSGELTVTIANDGADPIEPGGLCRLTYGDPTVAEHGPAGDLIGELEIPPLAPGDTLTLGPLPWTPPTGNSFGEPYFTILSQIDHPLDPSASIWPQEENNLAVLADFGFEGTAGEPAGLQFWIENPESTPLELRLEIVPEGEAITWEITTTPPAGSPQTLGPGETLPAEVMVIPGEFTTETVVRVEGFLYVPGGDLVRQSGGVTLRFHPASSRVPESPQNRPRLALEGIYPNPFHPPAAGRTGRRACATWSSCN